MNRRLRLLVSVFLLAVAASWVAVGVSRLEIDSDLDSLLPADEPAVQALDTVAREFGGDPVVILIEGAGDPLATDRLPPLLQLEGQLAELDGVVATYGPATTLNQVALRTKQMLAELSGQRDALEQAGLKDELRTFEERYGTLIVQAMPAGLPTLRNEGFVRSVVTDPDSGKVRAQWRQYLPAPEKAAIYLRPRENLDGPAAERLVEDVRRVVGSSDAVADVDVTVTGAPVIRVGLADQLGKEVPRLALTAFGVVALVLFLVPWTARRRWRLLPLLTMAAATAGTLASFGWRDVPLSLGAATFLPIILGLGSYYPVYLARTGHRRVVLAVAASATLAFGGLLLSPLPFVSDLGLAVPIGLTLVVVLSLLIGWLWPGLMAADQAARTTGRAPRAFGRVATAGALVVAVVGSAVGWVGLSSAELKTDPQQLLAGLSALDEAVHVEDVLGHSGEIGVRLVGDDVLTPEALTWARSAEQAVVTEFGDRVHPVVTVGQLFSFLGPEPSGDEIDAGFGALPAYITSAVVSADQTVALTSFGVAWSDLAGDRRLVAKVTEVLPAPPAGYAVEVAGLPVAAERGYDLVDKERYLASGIALLASALALVLLLPRRRDGLLALFASTMATGLTVAILVAVVGALNPLTLTLGALTAAVGSEFTVLLLAARRSADAAMKRSVLLAVLVSLGGYGALLTSSLPILRELGLALTCSVMISVLCAVALSTWSTRGSTPTAGLAGTAPEEAERPSPAAGDRLQLVGGA